MNEGRFVLPFSIGYAAAQTTMFTRDKKQNEIESEKNS